MRIGDTIGKPGDAQALQRSGDEGQGVVGLETPARIDGDGPVAVHELPCFRALHQGLMRGDLIGRLGGTVQGDIIRAGHQLAMDRPDATGEQV